MKLNSILFFFLCITTVSAYAQKRPSFQVLRFEENYDYLRDTSIKKNRLDKLKNIHLGGQSQLTLGGEINQTFEYVSTPFASQKEDGYWLQRLMLHGKFHINKNVSIYGELASGIIKGRNGGARTIDRDDLYVINLFTEWNKNNLRVRLGRQELSYGGENLISIRNGTNVRYTFDAARIVWKKKMVVVDAFAASYVNTKPGIFDNPFLDVKSNLVWGIYITRNAEKKSPGFSAYYMGYKDPQAFYVQYKGKEYRHSFGVRLNTVKGNFNNTLAAVYQLGKADTLAARAYQIGYVGTYQLNKTPVKIGINAYLSSGDNNPQDKTITSFNPYFPQQASFRGAMAARTFPMNIIFAGPRIDLNLYPFFISVDGGFLWRHRKTEGVNIPGGFPAYLQDKNTSAYMGNQTGFTVMHAVNPYLSILCIYSHFNPKAFLLNQPNPGQVNDFFIGKVIFKF